MSTPNEALQTAIGLLPFVQGDDGARPVGATIEDLATVPLIAEYPDLHLWLSRCNGLYLSVDLPILLGVGPRLHEGLRAECHGQIVDPESLRAETQIVESITDKHGWFPVAHDECGNVWVLHPGGVSFLDAMDYPELTYDAASSLGHFLVPILAKSVRVEDQWGFNEATVTRWDPDLVARSDRLPWNT
jgi:hypothetical protein